MRLYQAVILAVSLTAFAAAAEGPKEVSKQEFLERAEQTFQEGDADGDGKLSPSERKSLHEKRKERREDRRDDRHERNAQ